MKNFNELDSVVLNQKLPEHNLEIGDIGTIVAIYNQDEAYEVEFVTFKGNTVAVVTLLPNQIRNIEKKEIPHTRKLVTV